MSRSFEIRLQFRDSWLIGKWHFPFSLPYDGCSSFPPISPFVHVYFTMAHSISRITSMLESARDLTFETAVAASSKLVETPSHLRPKQISTYLNSPINRDKLVGLKCLFSLMSNSNNNSTGSNIDELLLSFFPDVVKNITSPNIKIKK